MKGDYYVCSKRSKNNIHKRLDAMHAARVTWEEGTLRAANEELYAILEGVYALYAELKAEVGKRRAFTALLTDLEIKTQANTSLALKWSATSLQGKAAVKLPTQASYGNRS